MSKIEREEIAVIYEEVQVQFDNAQQTPLGFKWRGMHYEVLKPLLVSKCPEGYLQYILLTNAGVFTLILLRERDDSTLSRSRWLLNYRVKDDEPFKDSGVAALSPGNFSEAAYSLPLGLSKPALVPIPLSNAAYYHGHLCPELAIGYRAAQIAFQELGLSRENAPQFFVITENMSSAIESLQLVTGCTIGNRNFFAYDLGKHVYYFGCFSNAHESKKALRLALINPVVDLSHKNELEKNIMAGQAGAAGLKEYQQAIDDAVEKILDLPNEELFSKTRIALHPPLVTTRQNYTKCSGCGEVVAVERSVPRKDGVYCRVCQAKTL